jgi:hypothetical protein
LGLRPTPFGCSTGREVLRRRRTGYTQRQRGASGRAIPSWVLRLVVDHQPWGVCMRAHMAVLMLLYGGCLLILGASCAARPVESVPSPVDIYYSQATADVRVTRDAGGHLVAVPAPSDLVRIHCRVGRADLPLFDSQSVGGDRSTALMDLLPGEQIPASAGTKQVRLHYNSGDLRAPFKVGDHRTLLFTTDGRFYGLAGDGVPATSDVYVVPSGPR